MHIVLVILGVVGAAAFWIYRIRDAGQAVGGAIDQAQRVRGNLKRRKFSRPSSAEPY